MNRTILVADDIAVNRRILMRILKEDGFDTLEAENGQVALDYLTNGSVPISLVLLDLTMPVMNGYELLEKMNELGLLISVPVIVTTGNDSNSAEIKCLEIGASDFIKKPYDEELVTHRVRSILRLYENAALINQMETDRLTGVYSREFFYRHVEAFLAEHPDDEYDILCSNIDNFKMINAKYGAEAADELLTYIGQHNLKCIGNDGVCGRLGADTFAALRKCRPLRSQEDASQAYAEGFKNAPIKNFIMQYGVFHIDDRTLPVPTMCDNAQLALSSIKHKYGVYYAVYDKSIKEKIMREHQLSDYMEQALEKRQFVVYLQPKHDVITRKLSGAEALVRWIHPELGFISPGEFIPLFERTGFISKLDHYVWEEVCHILSRWMKEGKNPIPVSVNVSRDDFISENLPELIGRMVEENDIPPELLHLEVTESAYSDNPQRIISDVSMLRSMGFVIEMDDFGSGYSSLNMLSELPIDMLKLDMRFMQNTNDVVPGGKRSILSFIVSLSKWLQLPTIAEGVETEEEVELLKSMGCNYIQGYYFAKPMPVTDFESYMNSSKIAEIHNEAVENPATMSAVSMLIRGKKQRVLVVEDIISNCILLDQILSPYYEVIQAHDGEQAYQYIKAHHSEISCILLDLLMPVMDGFQLLKLMKKDGYLSEIPVIITSEAGKESELRAIRLGATAFLAKPYQAELLLHHVTNAVREHEYFRCVKDENSQTDD